MSQYLKNHLDTASISFAIGAMLIATDAPASAEDRIGNILYDQNYHLTFDYEFGDNSKPEDFDGSTVWENNAWYLRPSAATNIVKQHDYVSLLAPAGTSKGPAGTSLTTWSKSKKALLVKFHYGYFEATMRFASNATNWPAFWALSANVPLLPKAPDGQAIGRWCEIDAYEGSTAGIVSSNVHDWVGHHSDEMKDQHKILPSGSNLSHWNSYGALWTKNTIKFYFNGTLINETVTPKPCQDTDAFMLLSAQTRDQSAGPTQLDIKRVRIYTN